MGEGPSCSTLSGTSTHGDCILFLKGAKHRVSSVLDPKIRQERADSQEGLEM